MSATLRDQPSIAEKADAAPNAEDGGTISYSAERIIGNGSFGVVFQASVVETGEIVAIKKVLQDKRFKNRELQIMRMLVQDPHCNIVALKHCFYSQVGSCMDLDMERQIIMGFLSLSIFLTHIFDLLFSFSILCCNDRVNNQMSYISILY